MWTGKVAPLLCGAPGLEEMASAHITPQKLPEPQWPNSHPFSRETRAGRWAAGSPHPTTPGLARPGPRPQPTQGPPQTQAGPRACPRRPGDTPRCTRAHPSPAQGTGRGEPASRTAMAGAQPKARSSHRRPGVQARASAGVGGPSRPLRAKPCRAGKSPHPAHLRAPTCPVPPGVNAGSVLPGLPTEGQHLCLTARNKTFLELGAHGPPWEALPSRDTQSPGPLPGHREWGLGRNGQIGHRGVSPCALGTRMGGTLMQG